MSGWDSGPKGPRKVAPSSAAESALSEINDPNDGARLIRAFLRITDPEVRRALIHMVETIGSAPPDRR